MTTSFIQAREGVFIQERLQLNNEINIFYQFLPNRYQRDNADGITNIFLSSNVNGDDFLHAVSLSGLANDNKQHVLMWDLKDRQWNIEKDESWIYPAYQYLRQNYNKTNFNNLTVISHNDGGEIATNFICKEKNNIKNWVHVGDIPNLNNNECDIKNINFLNINNNESNIQQFINKNKCQFLLGEQKTNYGYIKQQRCNNKNIELHIVENMPNKTWPGSIDQENKFLYANIDFNAIRYIDRFLSN